MIYIVVGVIIVMMIMKAITETNLTFAAGGVTTAEYERALEVLESEHDYSKEMNKKRRIASQIVKKYKEKVRLHSKWEQKTAEWEDYFFKNVKWKISGNKVVLMGIDSCDEKRKASCHIYTQDRYGIAWSKWMAIQRSLGDKPKTYCEPFN